MNNKKKLNKLRHNKLYQRELIKVINAFALFREGKISYNQHLDYCREFDNNVKGLIENDSNIERVPYGLSEDNLRKCIQEVIGENPEVELITKDGKALDLSSDEN